MPDSLPAPVEVRGAGPLWTMALLLFFSIVSALAGFVAGYLIGPGHFEREAKPPWKQEQPAAAKAPALPAPEATPSLPAPLPSPTPAEAATAPAPSAEEAEDIAGAESALRLFLNAPDVAARSPLVLRQEEVAAKMESYHAETEDGPTPPVSVEILATRETSPGGRVALVTFDVTTEAVPTGIPVTMVRTPDGWKADWETFVEFRDDHFRRFAAGEGGDEGSFHVILRKTHFFGDAFPGSDKLAAFRVDPPLPDREQYAFVPAGSALEASLSAAIQWGKPFHAEVTFARRPLEKSGHYLEITAIVATNWLPRE